MKNKQNKSICSKKARIDKIYIAKRDNNFLKLNIYGKRWEAFNLDCGYPCDIKSEANLTAMVNFLINENYKVYEFDNIQQLGAFLFNFSSLTKELKAGYNPIRKGGT